MSHADFFYNPSASGTVQGKPKKMKKILLSVLALLAFTFGGTAQTLPSYVPANGLVGWWPFNGNANDESGNNNNGTVNGATLSADRFGNAGKAYGFNGTTQNILLGDISAMEGDSHSISVWVNANQFNSTYTDIISKEGLVFNQRQWVLQVVNQKIGNTIFTVNNVYSHITQQSLITANWFHVVKSWDGSLLRTYINGQLDGTIPTTGSLVQANHNILIGGNPNFLDQYFNGKIDDVAFYNRALTQQEITGLYQGANTTTNCPTFPASLTQGLVGYWPFCGNALDESGNNNHGTVNGATLTTDRFGNVGSAYDFDGLNDFISINESNSLKPVNEITISLWANIDSTNSPSFIGLVNKYLEGAEPSYSSYQMITGNNTINQTGDAGFTIRTNNIYQWTGVTNASYLNQFHHLVGTYNGSILKCYKNGILVSTIDATGDIQYSSSNIDFGRRINNNGVIGLDTYFKGKLDDIAIWNRALTPQEIQQVYNQGICQTSITVTDTLLIHTGITSYNPVAYGNTLKVWPNPGNTAITLDAGNLALMQGWKIRISNAQGAQIYPATGQTGLISQQQQTLSMSGWGGNGLYFLYLIDPQNNIQEVKKIVLAP